jgi:hypothetical protein
MISDKALRDFAKRVLKTEQYQEENGIVVPQYNDAEIDMFVAQMNPEQLNTLYWMMFQTGFVE